MTAFIDGVERLLDDSGLWNTGALSRVGSLRTAYRLMLQTERPSFLCPVTMGATTGAENHA